LLDKDGNLTELGSLVLSKAGAWIGALIELWKTQSYLKVFYPGDSKPYWFNAVIIPWRYLLSIEYTCIYTPVTQRFRRNGPEMEDLRSCFSKCLHIRASWPWKETRFLYTHHLWLE
jgi:hypothetical protein